MGVLGKAATEEGEQLLRNHQKGGDDGDEDESFVAHARRVAVGIVSTVVFIGICAVVAVSIRGSGSASVGGVSLGAAQPLPGVDSSSHSAAGSRLTVKHAHLGSGPEEMVQLTSVPDEFISTSMRARLLDDPEDDPEDGDHAAGLGELEREQKPGRKLESNVFVITIGGLNEDKEAKQNLVGKLGREFGVEAVKTNVHLAPAIIAKNWPKDEKFADYALNEIRRLKNDDDDAMKHIPWLDHFTARAPDGTLNLGPEAPEGFDHHIGCLFAHLFVWQMALDSGKPNSVVFESDGISSANLAVPVASVQFAVDNAPDDFDLLFLNKLEDPAIDARFPHPVVKKATDESNGAEIHYYRYENPMAAGLSGYVASERFLGKIFPHIAERGADMVDAWLYKLCADPTDDRTEDENKVTLLRCYASIDKKIVDKYDKEHPDGQP